MFGVQLAMFRYYTKLCGKRVDLVQLMHKFVRWSHFEFFRNERTRSTPLDPKLMYMVFGCILDCFVTARSSIQNGLNWCNKCKISCREVASEFFAMSRSIPLDPKLIFCASHCFWVRFGLFYYYMKPVAKQVELVQLVQKFVPQIRIRIFCNKGSRSSHLGPKLMFWCVS